jgi:hypothetical protein
MLSPQHITKGTAVALMVGAFAAPAASAVPIGGYSRQDKQVSSQPQHVTAAPVAGYSRQDKQVSPSTQPRPVASDPTTPALPAWASSGAAAFHAGLSPTSPAVARATGPGDAFDWGDAGIGGGLMLSIVAIGGGVLLVQRRPRRTGKTTAVATG